jgi:hypothetical protein
VVDRWSHSTRINHDHGKSVFGWAVTGVRLDRKGISVRCGHGWGAAMGQMRPT